MGDSINHSPSVTTAGFFIPGTQPLPPIVGGRTDLISSGTYQGDGAKVVQTSPIRWSSNELRGFQPQTRPSQSGAQPPPFSQPPPPIKPGQAGQTDRHGHHNRQRREEEEEDAQRKLDSIQPSLQPERGKRAFIMALVKRRGSVFRPDLSSGLSESPRRDK